jgi:Spy/CpxP family protein refolding chaperone
MRDATRNATGDWKILVGAALAVLVGLAIATQADAGWFRHRGGHGPEQMREHAYRMVSRVFSEVDATDAQHEAARAIVDETFDRLAGFGFDRSETHGQLMALLRAETVDREAFEAVRAEKLAAAEEASRALSDGLVGLAEVLTPEQRAALPSRHGAWH